MDTERKDPAAVSLGRKGGLARAARMTAENRSAIARKAAIARWERVRALKVTDSPGPTKGQIHRMGILAALFRARSTNNDSPSMSNRELERLLVCPREHLEFGIWYLRGKRYIERADNGRVSITPEGVDAIEESAEITPQGTLKLLVGGVSDASA